MAMVMDTLPTRNNLFKNISQKRSQWIFFTLSIFSCIPLLYLFWKFDAAGFGYDIGIYRRSTIEYFHVFFDPQTPPFAFTAFSSFVLFLGDSTDSFLLGWYFILTFFTTYTFGILVRKTTHSNSISVLTLLLFSTSIIQFEFFAGFYYRNLLALFLLFSTLLIIEYKSYSACVLLIVLTAIHPLTAFVFFPTLCILGIFQKENRKFLFTILLIAGIGSVIFSYTEFIRYWKTLFNFLQNKEEALRYSSEFTGQFITPPQFLRFTLAYIPFALIGIYREGKKHIFWSIFGILNLSLIIFQFFLFERFYLFLNIFFIFFAAHGLHYIFQWFQNKKVFLVVTVAYSLFLFSAITWYTLQKTPLISSSDFTEIKNISTSIPKQSFILSFSSSDAPWLYGFAGDYKIIAPGTLHENKWNYETWFEFWSTKDTKKRAELLSQYDTKEIYFYASNNYKERAKNLFSNDPNISQINSHVWKYQFSL